MDTPTATATVEEFLGRLRSFMAPAGHPFLDAAAARMGMADALADNEHLRARLAELEGAAPGAPELEVVPEMDAS